MDAEQFAAELDDIVSLAEGEDVDLDLMISELQEQLAVLKRLRKRALALGDRPAARMEAFVCLLVEANQTA